MPIPARTATASTPRSVASRRCWAWRTRCWMSQAPGDCPVSSRNRRAKVRRLMPACRASAGTSVSRCSSAQARAAAVDSSGRGGTCRSMYCAWPPSRHGRHDAVAGHPVGDLGAVVDPDQVQAQVDAGAQPGAGQDVAVVGEQDVRVEQHVGVERCQVVGVLPVGGRRAAVQPAVRRRARTLRCRSRRGGRRAARVARAAATSRGEGPCRGVAPAAGCRARSRCPPCAGPRRRPAGRCR